MKKAFKSIISLLVMVVAFACCSAVSAEEEVWIKSTELLKMTRDDGYYIQFHKMAMGYNGEGSLVYCIKSTAVAPGENGTSNPQKYFYVGENKGLSTDIQKKVPGIISIIKDSQNSEIMRDNSGNTLSENDNYFITKYALWYYIEGLSGKVTQNSIEWMSKRSKYSNVFNTLVERAQKATSNGYANPQLSVVSKNSDSLSESMSSISGTTLKISDTVFSAKFSGTSNNNQDYKVVLTSSDGSNRSYLTDESGSVNYGSEHVFKADEGFRIIIDTSYATEEIKRVNVQFSVYGTVEESNDVLKVYSAINSNLNFQDVAYVEMNKISLEAPYKVSTEIDKNHEIEIVKVNSKDEKIAGAVIGVYNSNGEKVNEITSSATSGIKVSLAAGDYYIQEISAPEGYLINTDKIEFSIDESGNVKDSSDNVVVDKTLRIVNILPTIEIEKVNIKKVPVKNAKIVICSYDMNTKKESNCDFEWITDGTTKKLTIGVDFGEVKDGSYIIKEVSAPHGYELSNPKYITVKDGKLYGDLVKNTVTIVDEAYIEVSKTDATGQKELDGANMKLYDQDGKLIDEWISSSKEVHKISDLIPNDIYEIVETAAPEGYFPLETSIKFRINDDGKVEVLDCGTSSTECKVMSTEEILKIKNDVTKIKISKIDVTNGKELPGATLQILNETGKVVAEWKSSNEPHYIEMLPVGKYTLVEKFSPEGYVAVSNEVKFEIKSGSEVETVVFENDVTKVMISKRDFTTGEEIEGAKLQIIDSTGKVVHEWTSTKEPYYIEKLPVGKYTLVETIPAEGYQEGMYIDGDLTSKYEFEVKDNILVKIDVYNKTIKTPNTGLDVSSTYVIGGTAMLIGIGTITFARKKREA